MAQIKKAFIFGASGHSRVIASILHGNFHEIYFVDIHAASPQTITEIDFFNQIELHQKHAIFIGIGDNKIRENLYNKLIQHHITPQNCISQHAFIAHDAQLGNAVVICAGAVIGSQAIIHNNSIVNTLSSVDHDCVLGEHSQITAGVNFGGNTKTGKNCFFGIKSATIPNVTIGNNAVIMAASLVCNDVPDNVMVGGIPAKVVKKI